MAKRAKPTTAVFGRTEPQEIASIDFEYIIAYCKANNEIKWLQKQISTPCKGKDGKTRDASLFTVRKAFVDTFMPQLRKAKAEKATYKDIIMAL